MSRYLLSLVDVLTDLSLAAAERTHALFAAVGARGERGGR